MCHSHLHPHSLSLSLLPALPVHQPHQAVSLGRLGGTAACPSAHLSWVCVVSLLCALLWPAAADRQCYSAALLLCHLCICIQSNTHLLTLAHVELGPCWASVAAAAPQAVHTHTQTEQTQISALRRREVPAVVALSVYCAVMKFPPCFLLARLMLTEAVFDD